uniref:Mitochondrial import inner membrane translocase subunit n=1 Tax=Phallusia mammillata TaxID=59560 RepID=A0A6F9DVC7_9ASCI|nr:Tim10 small zinc finger-like protein [Phallusia mammillata]
MDPMQAQKLAAELEVEMMADMYNRMTASCHKKCISTKYNEGDLEKGEAVCIDRCVAKYLDIHEQIGKKLTQISQADEEAINKMTNAPAVAPTP